MLLHREAADLLATQFAQGPIVWISRQVIREYLAVLTPSQVFDAPLPHAELAKRVRTMEATFRVADENADVTSQLLALLGTYPTGGKQIHDANIVATMLAYNIPTLLTQNVDDMKRFADLIAIVPLRPVNS